MVIVCFVAISNSQFLFIILSDKASETPNFVLCYVSLNNKVRQADNQLLA